jgi:predicted phage terminase large subunit-like protein
MELTKEQMKMIRKAPRRKFLEYLKLLKKTDALKILIKERCRTDPALFAWIFFPHHCRLPFSSMHHDFFKKYTANINPDITLRRGSNEAVAAPRGFAKSTIRTLILPIHAILYNTERYIVIISATLKQAKQRLANVRNELLTNEEIKKYFNPDISGSKKKSWTQQCINVNDVQVEVYSAGTEIRGISYHEFRPTRIILDDAEDSFQVENADGRAKLMEWFNEVVENLGDSYTVIEVVGTLLHPESLLASLLKRPDFSGKIYRAIIDFAEDSTIWERWKRIFTNLSDENRLENARSFFRRNRNAMLKGSHVLWSAKEDYQDLMMQLITQGRSSFFQEKQNDPRAAEHRIFSRDRFRYFSYDGDRISITQPGKEDRIVNISDLQICGFLDSALGKGGRRGKKTGGDFAAIITVGQDKDGYYYVLDAWLKRCPPTKQITKIFDLHERFQYTRFGIETNFFQSLLLLPVEEEKKRRKEEGKPWDLYVDGINNSEKKETRIMRLEPLIANGWIIFNRALPEEFFRQLEDMPNGIHDDGPDALESALRIAKKSFQEEKGQNSHSPVLSRKSKNTLKLF